MKIDTKEINKINEALDSIDGWEIEDFKVWQTQSGKDMATIRLRKSDKKEELKPLEEEDLPLKGNSGGSSMAIGLNITSGEDD